VTADRCISISLGHPLAIDLTDCDVRLPSPHEILKHEGAPKSHPELDQPFACNTEMLKLSILFGRVMKTIYSPTGLMKTNDEEIVGLLTDIDTWKESLPPELVFTGPECAASAGVLHVAFACLQHLFFRVFMRISYNCPQHLSFSLNIERMTAMIKAAREAIEWVDRNPYYLDTMQFVSYCLVFCATLQYHAWLRRGEQKALATLKKCKECVTRFKREGAREELTLRAKTAEVITLLYEAALGAYADSAAAPSSGALNPTAGVSNKRTADTVRGIVFKPDQSKPGGGVYVAADRRLLLNDLPTGTILLHETEAGRVPALMRTTAQDGTSAWQTLPGGSTANGLDGLSASPLSQPPADFTHVAGDVWTDAQGAAVDRRGERLVTMIPVGAAQNMLQLQGAWNNNGAQAGQMVQALPDATQQDAASSELFPRRGSNGLSALNLNLNPHLNDAAWASTLAALGDAYTFDGQNLAPMPTGGSVTGGTGNMEPLFDFGMDFASWAQQLAVVNGAPATSGAEAQGGTDASRPANPTLGSIAGGDFR